MDVSPTVGVTGVLPDDEIVALSNPKALADDTSYVTGMVSIFFDRVEKGENADHQQLLLCHSHTVTPFDGPGKQAF